MRKIVVNNQYHSLNKFIDQLPETFQCQGKVFFEGRNLIKTFEWKGDTYNVKSFKKPILINQFVYKNFRKSKAERSYEYAIELKKQGFLTPDPIGYIEITHCGLLSESYYISKHETFDGNLQELRYGKTEEKEQLLYQFGSYTAQLHEAGIVHFDYSPANILYKKENGNYLFYLVDLNRMLFGKPIDLTTGCKAFRRLWGHDQMIELMVKTYAHNRGFDPLICIQKVFEYRKQFWNTFLKKHPGMVPYIENFKMPSDENRI